GPAPRLRVVVLIVSYSVTRTTPWTGSSTTSMIVSSMTGTPCLGAFLGAIFAAVFRARFFGVARSILTAGAFGFLIFTQCREISANIWDTDIAQKRPRQ